MSDHDRVRAAELPASEGGIFRNGEYTAVAVPPTQPVQRQLPPVSAHNPLSYVQHFTESRRNRAGVTATDE